MPELSAEQLAQRILECRLLDNRQTNQVFSALGSRGVSVDDFKSFLLQHEYLTNWQLNRVEDGHKTGFYYGNWKVLYLVGAGTFARVYRSVHLRTGDVKAVKVLRNRYASDLITRERFLREAQTVMKLRHPNIVPIHEVENHRGRIYMVMDFIEGQNMREFVQAQGTVKVSMALKVVRDILSGLDYAAQRGVSHRDIKLSNILLASSGRASLVDFGLAAADDHDEKRSGFFNPRSVDYAGLEKTTNAPRNDKRSDLYFVGVVLYHMLSGCSPLLVTRERMRRMSSERYRNIKPLGAIAPDLPHRVVTLVNKLMALDPEERFQTPRKALEEVMNVIQAIRKGESDRYDPALLEQEAAEYARRQARNHEGEGNTVMVVESNQHVQDTLRKKLKKIGYRVLILGDPVRALERFYELDPAEELPANAVIFGCAGLGTAGLEAFNDFANNRTCDAVPAILLVREEQLGQFLKNADLDTDRHRALSLPIKFPRIRTALRELLGLRIDQTEYAEDEDEF